MRISLVTIVVPDYDRGIAFYCGKLGFELSEDTDLGNGKRWIRVTPPGENQTGLLLARAVDATQTAAIGRQAGGRVGYFLTVDDFHQEYDRLRLLNVRFLERPRLEAYGWVAVFEDDFGNKWDLLSPAI